MGTFPFAMEVNLPRRPQGPRGAQLRAMLTAATMPRDLAAAYADRCREMAGRETDDRP
jgi:hypothetical protein